MKDIARRIGTSKALWIATALLIVYALVGYFLAPYLIARSLPEFAQRNLGAQATIGKVRVNPFLLQLEAKDFRLDSAGRPVVALDRLFVNLELRSLLRWAWSFADVQLDGLRVNAEIARDGRFNLADLADHWSKATPPAANKSPPRIIVRRFALRADFTFDDLSEPEPIAVKASAINLEVNELATIPDREGRYTVSGQLPGGGGISWQGNVSLQPIASAGEWRVTGLNLATVWQFFRNHLMIAEPRGSLTLAGKYEFSYTDGAAAFAARDVHAQVAALSLTRQGEQQPMLVVEKIEATDTQYDLVKHELILPRVELANGKFSAGLHADGTLDWQGAFREPPGATRSRREGSASTAFHMRAEAVSLDNVELHYADLTRVTPLEYAAGVQHADFKLDLASEEKSTRVVVDGIRFALNNASVRAAESKQALVDLKSISLDGGHLDTAARTAAIDSVASKGGSTVLAREADGRFALVEAFAAAPASKERAMVHDERAEQPWKYEVHAADISDLNIALEDSSYKPAVRYDMLAAVSLKSIVGDGKSPIELKAALRVAQGGTINGSGTLAQDFAQANVKLDAAEIDIGPLRPVLARYTILELKSGKVASAAARIDYRRGGKPALQVAGSAKISKVLVNEADTGDRFLSLRMLTADDIALTLSPDRVTVKEIRIEEPGAKIFVAKDRSVNITKVLKDLGGPRPVEQDKTQGNRFPVRVARLSLQHGILDFADNSLVLPFATRVKSVTGTIVGLSSAPRSRAELKFDGAIEPNGSATATGSLEPSNPRSFLDINAKFDNVEMPSLSPYTVTFAGRKVAAGRLSLDVQYKIVNSQLLGENKVVMADFALGEKVQAPNALDLPLDLAVALLKEPDGRIHLAVPVRGDIDNPTFDYGVLIRDAIANILTRIVSAPFRFIAGILGGNSDDNLQSISFEPGSARITPPMREQLQKMAQALKTRPQLKLIVHGVYDSKRDTHALRDAEVRRAVAQALDVKLQPGADPGPMAFDDAKTQRALEKLLSSRAGGSAIDSFVADYTKTTGKEARRVNPLLAALGRGRGDRDLYEALFEHLVEIEPLPDGSLADLASQRARAIAALIAQAGMDAARVELGKTQTVEDASKPLAATLALEAT